jgi:hypothetical protein
VRARRRANHRTSLPHAGLVAVEALGGEIVEIILKPSLGIEAEIAQECPGVDAGGVHVVEAQPHRIIADGIDREDRHVALAAHRLALRLRVTLHFRRGTRDPEQFGGEVKRLAVVKTDMQRAAIPGEPDFDRPGLGNGGWPQRRDQPGPTRLWPGSPTLAPLVVNAE